MKKLFKAILVLAFVGIVAAAVASYVSKKKLESMSDEEIREFLAQKLQGKVGDDQLETIQNSVIAGVRKTTAAMDSAEDAADGVVDATKDAVDEAVDSAKSAADDAVDAVKGAADATGDKAADAKDTANKKTSDVADAVKDAIES
jgi:sensor domain CHASE-containing protein